MKCIASIDSLCHWYFKISTVHTQVNNLVRWNCTLSQKNKTATAHISNLMAWSWKEKERQIRSTRCGCINNPYIKLTRWKKKVSSTHFQKIQQIPLCANSKEGLLIFFQYSRVDSPKREGNLNTKFNRMKISVQQTTRDTSKIVLNKKASTSIKGKILVNVLQIKKLLWIPNFSRK